MQTTTHFDVCIIGSGPGGYVAAIRAAQLGMSVAVVEKRGCFGGTCLNIGCIPSKAMLDSSEKYHTAGATFARHGIIADNLRIDLATMMSRKEKVVQTLVDGVAALLKSNHITTFSGIGRIASADTVTVLTPDGNISVHAGSIILATGSVPAQLPALPVDHELIVDSTDALSLDRVPRHLVVVGGGIIGVELASVWARLGAQTSIIEKMPQLAPGMDTQIARSLQRSLAGLGISMHLEAQVVECKRQAKTAVLQAKTKDGRIVDFPADKILIAVGRRPFTDGLGNDRVGIELNESTGRIMVDKGYQTSCRGVYAIGDLVHGPMLAHKAEDEGIAVAELLAGKPGHVNYDTIPSVIYTNPEVAYVGRTQEECRQQGIDYGAGIFHFKANGRALAADHADGFVKTLAERGSDRLLGVHIIGPNASELIVEAVTTMEYGGSAEDIARSVHAHPTYSEAVRESALAVDGRAIHAPPSNL
ncbi:MAG: dihydrolipoyl dehydrogenase [Chitinivibrionales bacterium]|nr:dihydrolipoyl dehydrogenase [Chitinivibrionales bacterium]